MNYRQSEVSNGLDKAIATSNATSSEMTSGIVSKVGNLLNQWLAPSNSDHLDGRS